MGESVTPASKNLGEKIGKIRQERERIFTKLEGLCRNLEPQLRDANQHHSADRLAALMGELDINTGELQELLISTPRGEMIAFFSEAFDRR